MDSIADNNAGINDFGGRDTDGAAEELDAMHAAWVSQCEADDAVLDEQQARDAMPDTDADDLADLREHARQQRERADAEMAEAERLERLTMTTEARLAAGAMALMNDFTSMLERKVS